MRATLATTISIFLGTTGSAEAIKPKDSSKKTLTTYSALWHRCDDRTNCSPGRNIRKWGVKTKKGKIRRAFNREITRSIRTFRRWEAPPMTVVLPGDKISNTTYKAGGKYAIPANKVACESGGNYRAINHNNPERPAGAYQIITKTWHAYGGGKYAATADAATPQQQDEIAANIWDGGNGANHWAC